MFLFIFESIGTSELLLIGIIALIFLGPRKLPQMARTIGKSMSDFRRATNEFKSTWEREVDFEKDDDPVSVPTIARENPAPSMTLPEIREADPELLKQVHPESETQSTDRAPESDKRSWL